MTLYPNKQDNPAAAIPVRLVAADGSAFYNAGGGGGGGAPYGATPLGYQQLSIATAQHLTVPATATFALIEVEGADARWRDDTTAPTATVGMPLYMGPHQVFSGDLAALQFISQGGAANLNISYYK